MDFLRLFVYVLAPWLPFLLRNWLYKLKVWQVFLAAIILLLPFLLPQFLNYSFSTSFLFSGTFILFLTALATICWLLTNTVRFLVFTSLINVLTITLFYFMNWKPAPRPEVDKPGFIEISSPVYAGIYTESFMGFRTYHLRKAVLGGLLVRSYELAPQNDTATCIYKAFDTDLNKKIIWDKCKNKLHTI